MKKNTVKKVQQGQKPNPGTVEAALVPIGVTERSMLRQINELRKATLTGRVKADDARIQIALLAQQIQIMAFPYKAVDLQIKAAQLRLEEVKHESREAGRLRSQERSLGYMHPLAIASVEANLAAGIRRKSAVQTAPANTRRR